MNNLPPLAPLPRDQRSIDADHLNLLAIFHFVGAGLALMGLLFIAAHFAFMRFIMMNPEFWQNQRGGPPPQQVMGVLEIFYAILGMWLIIFGILNVISGWFMLERKCRTFSLVVAGLNCVHMPLGTILGIFTIIVLVRESVRQMYEAPG